MKRHYTQSGPRAIGPYCTAAEAGGLVFFSGMLGVVPSTGKLAEGGAAAEARQSLANIRAVAEEFGVEFSRAVKALVFLTNMADFPAVNAVYAEAFGDAVPARSCVAVAALPAGASVEIELVFEKP